MDDLFVMKRELRRDDFSAMPFQKQVGITAKRSHTLSGIFLGLRISLPTIQNVGIAMQKTVAKRWYRHKITASACRSA